MLKTIKTIAEILTLPVVVTTLIFVGWGTCIANSDYEARTRPYIAIAGITANGIGNDSVDLNITMTNFGERPAMDIQLSQIAVSAGGVAYLIVDAADNMIVFPGRKIDFYTISIDRTTYEDLILGSKPLPIRLDYSSGDSEYWYRADIILLEDGWKIRDERGN
jgi:hypothetical protein